MGIKIKSDIMINDGTNNLLSLKNLCDSNIYSTTEKRVGTWINGKPIYRKVVSQPVSNWTGNKDINLGVSNVDVFTNARVLIDTDIYTAVGNTQGSTSYYLRNWVFRKTSTNNTVTVVNGLNTSITGIIYVVIEYTKTTD